MKGLKFFILWYAALTVAYAQVPADDSLLRALQRADTIQCFLTRGNRTYWSPQGVVSVQPAEFGRNGMFIVSAIDYRDNLAVVHWQDFSHQVQLLPSMGGLSFIYAPDQSSVFMTTIFAEFSGRSSSLKMTHSRHISWRGRARPSQYSGYCELN